MVEEIEIAALPIRRVRHHHRAEQSDRALAPPLLRHYKHTAIYIMSSSTL